MTGRCCTGDQDVAINATVEWANLTIEQWELLTVDDWYTLVIF